jgi:hypothetical protein
MIFPKVRIGDRLLTKPETAQTAQLFQRLITLEEQHRDEPVNWANSTVIIIKCVRYKGRSPKRQ